MQEIRLPNEEQHRFFMSELQQVRQDITAHFDKAVKALDYVANQSYSLWQLGDMLRDPEEKIKEMTTQVFELETRKLNIATEIADLMVARDEAEQKRVEALNTLVNVRFDLSDAQKELAAVREGVAEIKATLSAYVSRS